MTLTLEIPHELEERLRAEAEKHGQALPEYALQALEASVPTPAVSLASEVDTWNGPDFLKPLLEIAYSLPEEELQRLPSEGVQALDRYIYNGPTPRDGR